VKPGRNDEKGQSAAREAETAAPLGLAELVAMIQAGRFAELETRTREALERNPDSGLCWKALGVSLTMQGKDALQALQRAATLLPEDAEAHANLANALLGLGRPEDAVQSYARALALKPDFAEGRNNLGNALRALGRLQEAVASYVQALHIRPQFAEAHNNLGNALRSLGRYEDAIASYHKALQIKPHDAEAWNNLGNVELDLERPDAAASSYRRALEIKPDFAEACSNLGNALRGLGHFDEAVASYRRALALHPDFAGAHSNLSDALRDLGRLEEAAAGSRRAIEIDPGLAGAHNSLGNALADLGRLDEAEGSYRRALELRPGFAQASINLGLVLRQRGRPAEAEICCRTALETNPRAAPALVLLAELRADSGEFAAAEQLFLRAAAIDPDSPEAWAGIAHLRKMSVHDAAWAAQAQRIAAQRLAPRQEVYLRFALGKYGDDVKDFEGAFGNYRRAHELMKLYGAKYDRDQLTRAVDESIRHYRRESPRRHGSGALDSARPVFIVGMPRSGTSLAEQILASHPAIFGAGELTFWTSVAGAHAELARGGESDAAIVSGLAADYLRLLEGLSPGALRVVDKMPANFLALGLIHEALPNARIIHMRRNPIDTCLSIYFQHFKSAYPYANDLHDLAHYYNEYLRIMQHWRSALPEEAILDLPYEGLVADQEAWSRQMLQFIDVPWDARCLDFHRTERSVMTASKWQVRQKISASSVERWRNYQQFIEPLLGLAIPGR
jgi:tetratricopeptide (TPR) repeat protein